MGGIGEAKARVILEEIGERPPIKGSEWIIPVQNGDVYLSVHPELFVPKITSSNDKPTRYDCLSDAALWAKRLDNLNLCERSKMAIM